MSKLRQLKPEDAVFIGGEMSNVYQHTGGLLMLDASDSPDLCFEKYRDFVSQRIDNIPQFHWRLHEVPFGLDLPYWVEDRDFKLDNHIRHIAVPSPGDRDALVEVISHLYSKHLDRKRPLWEIWFIEGLPNRQFAVFQKVHHCMMDGQGATSLMESLWDHEPNGNRSKPEDSIADARPGEVPERWQESLNAAWHLYRAPFKTGQGLYGTLRNGIGKRLTSGETVSEKARTPTASFNTDISSHRGFVFGSLPLADVKIVKNGFSVTVNDVVLALVSGSLRDYLSAQSELPEESLRTIIAVSLREKGDDAFSNKVTTRSVTLATAIADPALRLQKITEETARAKQEARSGDGSMGQMDFIQLMPPLLIKAIMTIAPADQIARMAGANVVVSTVRGSDQPVYVAGARATGMYPMSVITPGGGMNITCFSNAGNIDVGITIDPDVVPDPWMLVEGLQKSLAEYVSLVTKRTPGKKKVATRAKAGAKKKKSPTARKKNPVKGGRHRR
jgi:diacylglycerol O-acyltransferase